MFKRGIFLLVAMLFALPSLAWAARPEYIIEIKEHLFYPSELILPENTKIKLIIINHDSTPEEFDSFDLNREKVIFPHKQAVIFIGPLIAGRYQFFGEFNPNTATGSILVVSAKTLAERK